MRNCFVPGCDAFCKAKGIKGRKMFLPPKKMFEEWLRVLPDKRRLKSHDRVCERHFDDAMIIKHWETNINGQTHLTPRDKPKLRENAVPSRNLQKTEAAVISSDVEPKIVALSHEIVVHTVQPKRKIKEPTNDISPKRLKKLDVEAVTEPEVLPEPKVINSPENRQIENNDDEKRLALFETLYDEAFDVTLPSLLWGIHRDPNRKFLVFSEFDTNSMSTSKYLHISDSLTCQALANHKLASTRMLTLSEATTETISGILDELSNEFLAFGTSDSKPKD